MGREDFDRPFDPAKIPAWTLEGRRAMLRKDQLAGWRVLGGMVILPGSLGLLLACIASGYHPERDFARLVVA